MMPAVSLRLVPEQDRIRLAQHYDDYRVDLGCRGHDPYFPLYWGEEGRVPLWVRHADTDAGFALLRVLGPADFELAEFAILPPYRRKGLGHQAARAVFAAFSGQWRVSVLPGNVVGQAFWHAHFARPPDDPGPPPCYRFKTATQSTPHARPMV